MVAKVMITSQPFLSFGLAFSSDKAHNLFTAMFDPWYKTVNIPVILTSNLGTLSFHGFDNVSFLNVFCTCAMAKNLLSSKK